MWDHLMGTNYPVGKPPSWGQAGGVEHIDARGGGPSRPFTGTLRPPASGFAARSSQIYRSISALNAATSANRLMSNTEINAP